MNTSDIAIYEAEGGRPKLQIKLDREIVWLTRKPMAERLDQECQNRQRAHQ